MKKIDKMMLVSVLALAIIWTMCVIFGGLGVGIVLGVGAYLACVFIYGKELGKKQSKEVKWLLVPIGLTTLCFLLFSNSVLRVFNVIFLIGLLLIHAIEYFEKSTYEMFLPEWCKDIVSFGLTLPFIKLEQPVVLIKDEISAGNKEKMKVIGKILLGLILALPALLIVVGLLVSSDAAFEGVMELMLEQFFNINLSWIFTRGFVTIILFFMCFSYFWGLTHQEEGDADLVNQREEDGAGEIQEKKGLDFVIVATITTLLCFVYVVFCLSQSVYFVSAFQGVLPSNVYSMSEYARRGFFETLPLAAFNLIVICILCRSTNYEGSAKKKHYTLGGVCFIAAFTLFMVVCALFKMVMYMERFGLTIKRVQVAWFLCLIVIVVVLVLVKVFVERFRFIRNLFIAFIVMYMSFNYANVDYLVASYNVALYEAGVTNDLSGCYDLSPAAVGPITKMIEKDKSLLQNKEVYDLLQGFRREAILNTWQEWNLTDYVAIKETQNIEMEE